MKKKVDHNPDLDRLVDWPTKYKLGSKGPTVKQLLDSGFCRIRASADVRDCIARLDKKDWMDYVQVEFPGSGSWSREKCADRFRCLLAKGFRNVPTPLLEQLPFSDEADAPTEFRYHWSFAGKRVEVEPKIKPEAQPDPMKKVRGISKAAAKAAAAEKAKALEGEHHPAPDPVPPMPKEYEMVTLTDGTQVSMSKQDSDNPFAALAAMAHDHDDDSRTESPAPVPPQQRAPAAVDDIEDGEWSHVHDTPAPTAHVDTLSLEPLPTKVVVVKFEVTGDREYFYFAPDDAKPGDWAVVYAKLENDTGARFAIGQIERDDPDLEGMARYAVLGVFNEAFAQSIQARMDRVSQIKARLQRKKQQFDERHIYELMAKVDPEARELLDLLKKLEGEL